MLVRQVGPAQVAVAQIEIGKLAVCERGDNGLSHRQTHPQGRQQVGAVAVRSWAGRLSAQVRAEDLRNGGTFTTDGGRDVGHGLDGSDTDSSLVAAESLECQLEPF